MRGLVSLADFSLSDFIILSTTFLGRCNYSGGELNGYIQSLRPLPPVQGIVGLK